MDRGAFLDVIGVIQSQFDELAGEGIVKVTDELAFMKLRPEDIDAEIYVVCRFGGATTNYGQTSLPVSLIACGYLNKTDVIKSILTEYALRYNLYDKAEIGGIYAIQFVSTPTAAQNFAEMSNGFATLFVMSGYITFGEGANYVSSLIYTNGDGEEETLKTMSANISLNIANNSQPKLGSGGLTSSVGQYGTLTLSFSTYLTEGGLLGELIDLCQNPSYEGMDKTYHIAVSFKDGKKIEKDWRLVSFAPSQNLGALPMATVAMTL